MYNIQADVRKFKLATKRPLPTAPTIIPLEARILHSKLILEEALEQIEAMGVQLEYQFGDDYGKPSGTEVVEAGFFGYKQGAEVDLMKVADGCVDQIYVTIGAAQEFGINLAPVWDIVQRANMAKFGPGAYRRPDGKQMKPPGWLPPDQEIRDELLRQVHEGNNLSTLHGT